MAIIYSTQLFIYADAPAQLVAHDNGAVFLHTLKGVSFTTNEWHIKDIPTLIEKLRVFLTGRVFEESTD